MNSESMPPELDVFISLLGEIDMLKGQVSVLDKNTHIALSHSDTSAILGNAECFRILKMIETLNANISGLNASLLNAAELVTKQCEVDDDCSDCGARHMSPVRTEEHPDYDPQKVFVVIEMWEGLVNEVNVFKNDPDPDNVFKCDEHWDNGKKVFSVDINEGKVWT